MDTLIFKFNARASGPSVLYNAALSYSLCKN